MGVSRHYRLFKPDTWTADCKLATWEEMGGLLLMEKSICFMIHEAYSIRSLQFSLIKVHEGASGLIMHPKHISMEHYGYVRNANKCGM